MLFGASSFNLLGNGHGSRFFNIENKKVFKKLEF